jgi:predicted RNA-binding Zn-ribbon protein involved in translation (DUF1610 family)
VSKKDHQQIFASARQQGWTTRVGAGSHMELWCPCHGVCVTKASTTPGDIRGAERLKQDLKAHGWLPPGEYREKVKQERREAKKTRRDARLAAADETPAGQEEQEVREVSDVPQIGDVARVTQRGGEPVDPRELMPANDILQNLPLAAELLWEKVIEKIKEAGPEPMKLQSVAGYRWEGSRDGAMRELWPSIPRGEASSPQTDPRRLKLAIYLKQTNNMICLDKGSRYKKSIWWVRAEFSRQAPGAERELTTWAERRLTTAEAGEDRAPAPVVVTRTTVTPTTASDHDDDVAAADTTCPECGTELAASVLDDHRLESHFVCPECGRKDKDLRRINLHRSKHHGYRAPTYDQNRRMREIANGLQPVDRNPDGFFHCPDCNLVTESVKRFGTHRRAYLNQPHPEAKFGCRRCKEMLNDRDDLYHHYLVIHNESVSICKGCGEALLGRQALNDHKVNTHGVVFTKKGEIWPDEPPARDDPKLNKTINEPTVAWVPETEEMIIDPLTAVQRILTENAELKARVTSLERTLDEVERELSETKQEYDRLAARDDAVRLEEDLEKVTKERDSLRDTLNQLNAALSGLKTMGAS